MISLRSEHEQQMPLDNINAMQNINILLFVRSLSFTSLKL